MAMLNNQRVSVRDGVYKPANITSKQHPPEIEKLVFLATKNHGDFSNKMAIQLTQMKS
jgi:hypothetical protein